MCLYGVGEGQLALDLDFGQHRRVRGILPSRPPVAISSKACRTPGAGGRAVGGEKGRAAGPANDQSPTPRGRTPAPIKASSPGDGILMTQFPRHRDYLKMLGSPASVA